MIYTRCINYFISRIINVYVWQSWFAIVGADRIRFPPCKIASGHCRIAIVCIRMHHMNLMYLYHVTSRVRVHPHASICLRYTSEWQCLTLIPQGQCNTTENNKTDGNNTLPLIFVIAFGRDRSIQIHPHKANRSNIYRTQMCILCDTNGLVTNQV